MFISLDDSTLTPSFTVPNVSEDTAVEFTLTVSDGTTDVSDQIIITITDSANTAPTVNAGTDQEITEGDTVTLAGTATDADQEDDLTYSWSHDSTLFISLDDSTLTPSFTVPNVSEDTAVEFTLTVSDGTTDVSDQIIITITDSANTAPTVNAGTDQEITEGDTVTLAGTATDADPEDDLTYSWSHDSTLFISLDDSTLTPSFTVPNVSEDTAVEFTLTVSDGTTDVSDQIIITITDSANTAPTVNAGTDQEITEGDTVTLAGTATDADQEDDLTYSWSHDSTLFISLDDSTLTPSFTVPNVSEDTAVEFTLTVSDGTTDVSDQIIITITDSANTAPTVNAGTDQEITEGDTVTLAGTATDADQEDDLTYSWSHDSTLFISLDDSTLTPSFTVPNVSEDTAVEFTLTVSDGTTDVSDQIIITITDSANTAPTVNAGTDQEITEGDTVTLAGTATDADQEDDLTYSWSHDSTLFISLDDSTLTPSFTVPNVSEDTAVEFTLTVSDGTTDVSDQIIITITDSANTAPTVNAGTDQEITEGDTVTLAGTATDADQEDDLTYSWSHDSTLFISLDDSTLTPSFTVPNVSEDTAVEFTLTVSDGIITVSDSIIITITDSANTAPTVNAGTDQEITEGDTVTLAGTATDADQEDDLTYSWSHDSTLFISLDDSTLTPSFTVPNVSEDTAVEFTLTVSDGTTDVSDQIIITITDSANTAPTVNAGTDQEITEGSTVTLAGTATDADQEDDLTYSWSHDSTLFISLDDSTLTPSFTVPNVSEDTAVEFTLTVSDGIITVSDSIIITITDSANTAPTVNAGTDQEITEGSTVTLAGTATDADQEDDLTYSWSHDSTLFISLDDSTLTPSFTVPNVSEDTAVEFTLTVSDGIITVSDSIIITITDSANTAPTVNAGTDQEITEGSTVTLAGTATDADQEDDLTYSWSHDSTLFISLDDSTLTPSFTVPNVSEDTAVEFTLTVSDGIITVSDSIIITITDSANTAPTVNAGTDQEITEGSTVTLAGTATDADQEDDLTYSWSHDSTLFISLDDSTLTPSFTVPNVSEDTAVEFTLTVSDGIITVSDSIIITITDSANTAPTADAGADQEITEGSTVTLAGTATDADQEDDLTYSWSHDSTLFISLDDSTLTPSFTVPNVSEDTAVEFTLTVSDGIITVSDSIIITITDSANTAPTADAGADQEITEGSTVTLAGTATDADQEDDLTYSWSHDSTLFISLDDSTLTPSFTVPNVSEDTAVEFTLTVSDGTTQISDSVIITITDSANTAPTADAGADQEITEGSTVTLAGTATDADQEDDLTYSWSHDSTLFISLDDSTLTPSFTVPNVSEDTAVEFTLTVSDGTTQISDSVIITITDSANTAPTADAGADQEITEGSTVTLAGTATDADQEDDLTYSWSHDSTLFISLDDSTLTPSFTVPNVSEDTAVEFTLTVSDGTTQISDSVIITITDSANTAPTADAGADREVVEGSTVTLAGNSTDSDSLTYSWRQTSGLPVVDLQGANTPSPTFTAPVVASDTVFIFEMTVNDGSEILTDTVEITIRDMPDLSYFITTWRTGTAGESITIPVGGATGTYTVDWGDGNTSVNVTGDQTHLYDDAGTHTVRISGDFTRIYLNEYPSNADKLVSIERWGDTRWESMISAFHGASNMVYRATDVPVLSDVTSMRYMFYDAQSFDGDLSGWDVSRVTDMAGAFWGASSFDGDLSGWDVSRVTDMTGAFWGASSFHGDLSGWDVLSVTNMRSMFNGASSFNGDLSGWDVSSVTDMTSMFTGTSSFNGDLSGWDVSHVTGMFAMFSAADSFDADLSDWDVSSVDTMSVMFRGASSFDADLSDWDVSSVDTMSVMFMDASSFDADLSDWDVSRVTDMSNMFRGTSSFDGDLSDWDVSRVTDMSDMFSGAHSFNADISDWDVSRVTDMYAMFNGAHSFNADISSWSVSRVTDMYAMFNGAHSFNADISGWDVSRVTDMFDMFYQTNAFDQNLGKWYIVLDDAVIEGDNATGTVGGIAAQNSFLGAQNPAYGIGSGVDSASFEMDGASLRLKAVSDHLTGDSYTVNVTSSGGFGTNNFRILEVSVKVSGILPATGTDINQTPLVEPAVPLVAPQNLRAASTDTTVTLTWDHTDDDSITGYKILSRTPATQSQLSVLVDDTGAPGTSYVIEGLDPDTVYVFRVIAVNAHGESDSSNFVRLSTDVASTPASAPDAPQNLWAVSTDTTVTLTWDSPDDDSITGYKILSRTPATQSQLSVLVDDTGAPGTSYVIEGLDPDTVYVFRVIAVNAHGESDNSNFVRLSTLS